MCLQPCTKPVLVSTVKFPIHNNCTEGHCLRGEGFPNFLAHNPQNNGARDLRPPLSLTAVLIFGISLRMNKTTMKTWIISHKTSESFR